MISSSNILRALSDDKTSVIFHTVALGNISDAATMAAKLGITRRQYYSRLAKITNADLVRKETKGKYHLTSLGEVVYGSLLTIDKALKNYWALKLVESCRINSSLSTDGEIPKLIDALINDKHVKGFLAEIIVPK